jgi:hypothetical protein
MVTGEVTALELAQSWVLLSAKQLAVQWWVLRWVDLWKGEQLDEQ